MLPQILLPRAARALPKETQEGTAGSDRAFFKLGLSLGHTVRLFRSSFVVATGPAPGYETFGRPERRGALGYEAVRRPERLGALGYETFDNPEPAPALGYETFGRLGTPGSSKQH